MKEKDNVLKFVAKGSVAGDRKKVERLNEHPGRDVWINTEDLLGEGRKEEDIFEILKAARTLEHSQVIILSRDYKGLCSNISKYFKGQSEEDYWWGCNHIWLGKVSAKGEKESLNGLAYDPYWIRYMPSLLEKIHGKWDYEDRWVWFGGKWSGSHLDRKFHLKSSMLREGFRKEGGKGIDFLNGWTYDVQTYKIKPNPTGKKVDGQKEFPFSLTQWASIINTRPIRSGQWPEPVEEVGKYEKVGILYTSDDEKLFTGHDGELTEGWS